MVEYDNANMYDTLIYLLNMSNTLIIYIMAEYGNANMYNTHIYLLNMYYTLIYLLNM